MREKLFQEMCLQQKKRVRVPKALGSNVENGFGVIFLHANEIIMRAWSGYQKQALHLSSRVWWDKRNGLTFRYRPCSKVSIIYPF